MAPLAAGIREDAVDMPDSAYEIEASERFDKSGLVRAHELHRLSMPNVAEASAANVDSVPVHSDGLKPILISHLHVGCYHSGRVLHGRLCVEPIKLVAVETIIEDMAGRAAKLFIYNALPSSASSQEARHMFRKGLMVAIKAPYLKRAKDGCLVIRVDNLASINVEQSCGPDHIPTQQFLKSQSHEDAVSASRQLRRRGNEAFEICDWKLSTQLYTDALLLLLRHENEYTVSDHFKPMISQELVLALSNRAEARLRLEHFERAERDACKALHLDPAHMKSLYRRGRAFHGLCLYEEAAIYFNKAFDLISKQQSRCTSYVGMRQEISQALKLSQVCHNQASTGEFNFAQICEDEQRGQDPICAEYIGPVMVGRAMDKALGRGLLVTKDVKRGDLLLVTKAVAHSVSTPEAVNIHGAAQIGSQSGQITAGYHKDIAKQLVQLAMASPRFKDQLYSLAPDSALDVNVEDLKIPDMALFKPCKPSCATKEEITIDEEIPGEVSGIDVDRIGGIARVNSFEHFSHNFGATMWLLASFINHSCMPTACWVRVKDHTLFVRAACDMHRGQEITIFYGTNKLAAMPYSVRATFCKEFRGFECRCQRCVFERSVLPFTRPLEANLLSVLSFTGALEANVLGFFEANDLGLLETSEIAARISKETVYSLEWVLGHCSAIEEEKQKEWLRTSFAIAYWRGMRDEYDIEEETDDLWVKAILRAVHRTMGSVEEMVLLQPPLRAHALYGCLSMMRRMRECLYGKQSPAALQRILAARTKLLNAALLTKH